MILDIILSDHKAGRDLFSLAGNSVFEGYAERADLFERFDRLWTAHADMMDEAVFPVLAQVTHRAEPLEQMRQGQDELRGTIAGLAARAADKSNENDQWFADFHRLKPQFEQQVDREDTVIASMIQQDLRPEQIARMTMTAEGLRKRRAG